MSPSEAKWTDVSVDVLVNSLACYLQELLYRLQPHQFVQYASNFRDSLVDPDDHKTINSLFTSFDVLRTNVLEHIMSSRDESQTQTVLRYLQATVRSRRHLNFHAVAVFVSVLTMPVIVELEHVWTVPHPSSLSSPPHILITRVSRVRMQT